MSEKDSPFRRWAELMDRGAVGEPLSSEDVAFCERFAESNEASQRELALLDELSDLDAAPSAESRAIVDGALARLAAEAVRAEHDEVSQLKRPRFPRSAWLSGVAAVAAVGLAIWIVPRKPATPNTTAQQSPIPRTELVYAAGEVRVDGKLIDGASALLAEGSVIDVGAGAACLAMDPGIDVCASEQTRLKLTRTHSIWRMLDLESGKVAVQLVPQPEGWRLSIVSDGVWSTAVGTAFTVERNPSDGVRTTVLNGKVRVGSDGGNEQLVTAHQRAQLHNGRATLASVSRNDESPEWAMLRPAALWSNPVTSMLELHGLAAGTEVVLDGQMIGVAPLSTLVPIGGHTLQARSDGHVLATRDFVAQAGQPTVLSFAALSAAPSLTEPAPAASATPVAGPPRSGMREQRVPHSAPATAQAAEAHPEPATAAAPATGGAAPASVGDMLTEAHKLMRTGRFDAAAAQYESLRQTYPNSPEAFTVLVSLAELQVDRLGSPEQALRNLDRYLDAGGATLAEEARQVRIRALRALGERSREATAIEEFLRAYPKSFQAPVLQRRLAELTEQP
jgi:hypothetical protein